MIKTIVIGAGVMGRLGRVSAGAVWHRRYGAGSDARQRRRLRHQLRVEQCQQKAAEILSPSECRRHAGGVGANSKGLFEPSGGSAPDLAGKDIANPLAMILSAAMMLRYSLNRPEQAARIENAFKKMLKAGLRTGDIWQEGCRRIGTREMGDAVLRAL